MQASFYIVPGRTPLLGMDLFTALHLDTRNGSVGSFVENGQAAVKFTEPLGLAADFVHKINVHSFTLCHTLRKFLQNYVGHFKG